MDKSGAFVLKSSVVITMSDVDALTRVHTYIDTVATRYKTHQNALYLEGVCVALEYLLDQEVSTVNDVALLEAIKQAAAAIEAVALDKETVRKAVQLALLHGFKEAQITNAQMTPDTVGIFLSYLIGKLYPKNPPKRVFDPLVGTGNLLATLALHGAPLETIIGVDDDPLMARIARNVLDALDLRNQIYLQDTLTFAGPEVDLMVSDFPPHPRDGSKPYLPYYVILHHLRHLKVGHYAIFIIENDFFDHAKGQTFRAMLAEDAHLFGLIKLDESLFSTMPKSLLIIKKKIDAEEKLDDFLLVDLPAFTDQAAFARSLQTMDRWFKKKEVDIQ
ncbi:MAG: class I SAM-dependent methyltransferase [Acholeplasmatales bacterium]|nr:MAG: class I SAM-dependent methyltransferase [Acholeplasmatales bacterium]